MVRVRFICMSLWWLLSSKKVEYVVDCAFWIDGLQKDVALLCVWLWESDGYAEYDEIMDGINELIDDSFEDTQLFMLQFFLGRKL